MALLKSQYPKQWQQTHCGAVGHDLMVWSASKLSQLDISDGKEPRAETEQRAGECHASSLSAVQKHIVCPLTIQTMSSEKLKNTLPPSRDSCFCSDKYSCAL